MIIINGYIIAVEKTDKEFNNIIEIINQKPSDKEGYQYKLRADTLKWELVELPKPSEDYEITDEEAFSIILGGAE